MERVGFAGALNVATFKAVIVIALGLVLALDATADGIYRWVSMPCPGRKACRQRLSVVEPEEASC